MNMNEVKKFMSAMRDIKIQCDDLADSVGKLNLGDVIDGAVAAYLAAAVFAMTMVTQLVSDRVVRG